jgi:SAM-dependent methyltransferase
MTHISTNRGGIYRVLDHPFVYRLNRFMVAPGAVGDLRRVVRRVAEQVPVGGRVLDVACGPESWLESAGVEVVGADLMEGYVRHFVGRGRKGVVAAADALPFADGSFESVWTMALLHHLPDEMVRRTVEQMRRVCRPGGLIVVLDGVFPGRVWHNPFAYAVRAADRGQFMRSAESLVQLLPGAGWQSEQFHVAWTRLPFVCCTCRK